MTKNQLIHKLIGDYPMARDAGIRLIVDTLLPDVSDDRKEVSEEVIEAFASACEEAAVGFATCEDER